MFHSQEVRGRDAERSTEVEPQEDGVFEDSEGQLLARREPHLATEDRIQATFPATLLTSCGTEGKSLNLSGLCFHRWGERHYPTYSACIQGH